MKTTALLATPLLATLLLGAAPPAEARELNVVTSFTVISDIVREVGGDHVHVANLVGANGDPHVFEPTPQDGRTLSQADLVFVSGLGMEGWMERLIRASGYQGRVVTLSDGIQTRTMAEDGETITDPHAWNSAANGAIYALNATRALAEADPEDATAIRAGGEAYAARLRALDAWARAELADLPAPKRKVITSHDAFGYMGAAYGIEFLAPEGFSTESEASAGDLARLIDQIRQEGIKTVYIENSNDPRLVRQIAAETGATLGGELYPESLTGPDGPAPTYEAMFRYNVEELTKGMRTN